MNSALKTLAVVTASALLTASPIGAGAAEQKTTPYAPFEFLIGEWDVTPEGGGPLVADQTFRWGPNRSYIWYAQNLIMNGKAEPHFEGVLMWNGVRKNLDMLLEMDLQHGLTDEAGTVSVQADGSVVRDITTSYSAGVQPLGEPAAGADGLVAHFRQTYRAIAPGKVLTTVMRQTPGGWVATFPGSDHLLMTMRAR